MRDNRNDSDEEHVPALLNRREALKAGAATAIMSFFGGANSIAQATEATYGSAGKVRDAATEWSSYGGNKASSKYSPLAQISGRNFNRLTTAWTWQSVEEEVAKGNHLKTWAWESTPLKVEGVLYISTSLSQVAAIDAATGKTLWVYDPETWKNGTPSNNGFVHRGVTYWADADDQRILFGTGDGYLICLNAATGKPISTFGDEGRIDLTQGLGRSVDRHLYGVSSPPVICRDVVVMGSKVNDIPLAAEMPPGHVRGFDIRTGKQRWIFHSIPLHQQPAFEGSKPTYLRYCMNAASLNSSNKGRLLSVVAKFRHKVSACCRNVVSIGPDFRMSLVLEAGHRRSVTARPSKRVAGRSSEYEPYFFQVFPSVLTRLVNSLPPLQAQPSVREVNRKRGGVAS